MVADSQKELNHIRNGKVTDAREDFLQQIRAKVSYFLASLLKYSFHLLVLFGWMLNYPNRYKPGVYMMHGRFYSLLKAVQIKLSKHSAWYVKSVPLCYCLLLVIGKERP